MEGNRKQSNSFNCPQCGQVISDNMKYCPECGERLYQYIMRCRNCHLDIVVRDDVPYITCPRCGHRTQSPNFEIDKFT